MIADSEGFDVTLVGFGPTGATLANLLGRQGVRTLVIERARGIGTRGLLDAPGPRGLRRGTNVMRIRCCAR